jgi:hypothetical protein
MDCIDGLPGRGNQRFDEAAIATPEIGQAQIR